ncbi:hypothetical protein TAMA11512_15350 [Selenomonas sp. TAMA-11512]|uniref:restriction endonuclease n=1 Tax=Selenomonas sp. TAMA-11512 TaxID=3095337 RepID=UPI00308F43FE|nr:hypothetical protein TAMA11512_15350 [Selenomonas sp. TAMA-11512]
MTCIVDHIAYDMIEGSYDAHIFTTEKRPIAEAYAADRAIQDYVFTDSKVERKFAEAIDGRDEVLIYAKLPRGFAIPTPVGNYAPDWAIVFREGTMKNIYFVAETKGSLSSLDISPIEKAKIKCAKRLFETLHGDCVIYEHVKDFEGLLKRVMQ